MTIWDSAANGDIAALKEELSSGKDIDIRNELGWSPLLVATSTADVKTVKYLLAQGADTNVQLPRGHTALHISIDTAAWRMDRRAPSGGFQDSLHEQCINIHEALLLHKADPNIAKTPSGETPLHDAASYGFPDFIQLLLDAGARTESKDSLGRTPLIAAVARGHTRAALALLKGGADIHATLGPGFSALHVAAEDGDLTTGQVLVDWGIDFNRRLSGTFESYPKGATALDVSRKMKQTKFSKWLEELIDAL